MIWEILFFSCLSLFCCDLFKAVSLIFQALVRWIDAESTDTPRVTPKHSREELVTLPKPVEAFKEWKEWITRCLAVLQK